MLDTRHPGRIPVGPRGDRGFTLLEAIIAIAILALALGATLAFHGNILGSAADNRLRSAAMSLAEDKIEWLRSVPFDAADLEEGTTEETVANISAFGIFSNNPVSLTRCWTIVDEPSTAPLAKRVQVAVSRQGGTCNPWSADALATLSTRIARNDFVRSGRKLAEDLLYNPDGRGELVPREDGWPTFGDAPALEGGFEVLELPNPDGTGSGQYVICDRSTCLFPNPDEGGNQAFATLNGNIFLSGRGCSVGRDDDSLEGPCEVELFVEGNALCRMTLHERDTSAPVIPGSGATAGGASQPLSYIRYSCVLADQWRRSISLIPRDSEKVCVGGPGLVLDPADPGDQLKSFTRFYDGRGATLANDGTIAEEYPSGLKGGPLQGPMRAVIGSVCGELDACAEDETVRGLVPGGHHFMVMQDGSGSVACSERMRELELLDDPAGARYSSLFVHNPDAFYCTSEKTYTGDFCSSYTRVSGFIGNETTFDVGSGDFTIEAKNARLEPPCDFFGAYVANGGGYVCGINNLATRAVVTGTPLEPWLEFSDPDTYDFATAGSRPVDFPLDATARTFTLQDAPAISCNVSVSGTLPRTTAGDSAIWTAAYRYDSSLPEDWMPCSVVEVLGAGDLESSTIYQCSIPAAFQGRTVEIEASDLDPATPSEYASFEVDCGEPVRVIDFAPVEAP